MANDAPNSGNHFLNSFVNACQVNADKTIFRPYNKDTESWGFVSYQQFFDLLTAAASHWKKTLDPAQVGESNVVAFWLTGQKYFDFVSILSVSLAGFIPQACSTWHANVNVIYDLMKLSGAKIIICDESLASAIDPTRVGLKVVPNYAELSPSTESIQTPMVKPHDTAVIFHSSGTTSKTGTPKLIPNSHLWVKTFVERKFPGICCQVPVPEPASCNTVGSMAHIATVMAFLAGSYLGWTTVQSPSMTPEGQLAMIKACDVKCALLYAGTVSDLLAMARKDESVEKVLQGMHELCHTGWTLPQEDEDWGFEHNIKLLGIYGTTENATLLITTYGGETPQDRLYKTYEGSGAQFLPFDFKLPSQTNGNATDTNGVAREPQKLFEIVVPASSPDAPHPSKIAEDGFYHVEDLFEEVYPGRYRYRGRYGDFIRMDVRGGLCDARQLEDRIRSLCSGKIIDCVVVGTYKPTPAVIVEVSDEKYTDENFKTELVHYIINEMRAYNERLFPWERITDTKRVLIIKQGSLPRNKEKNNIRRPATEDLFAKEIEALYA